MVRYPDGFRRGIRSFTPPRSMATFCRRTVSPASGKSAAANSRNPATRKTDRVGQKIGCPCGKPVRPGPRFVAQPRFAPRSPGRLHAGADRVIESRIRRHLRTLRPLCSSRLNLGGARAEQTDGGVKWGTQEIRRNGVAEARSAASRRQLRQCRSQTGPTSCIAQSSTLTVSGISDH